VPPTPRFHLKAKPRSGVSELYASMLMVGVTLSLGSFVAAAAVSQFGLAGGSASLGASMEQSSSGVALGLVYVAVAPSVSCPVSGGYHEGNSITLALFNYGTTSFTPAEVAVNSTIYPGSYPAVAPGTLGQYAISLGSCAHGWAQTLLVLDSSGDGVELGS
jgi:hypothetical protein